MVGDTLAIGLDPGPGHVLRPHITDMGLATAFASHVPRYFNQRQNQPRQQRFAQRKQSVKENIAVYAEQEISLLMHLQN